MFQKNKYGLIAVSFLVLCSIFVILLIHLDTDEQSGPIRQPLTTISAPQTTTPVSVVPVELTTIVTVPPTTLAPTTQPLPTPTTRASRSRPTVAATTTPVSITTETSIEPVKPSTPDLETSNPSEWSRSEASWYGPGLYGNGTACGQRYTPEIVGVAHKTLPCGTTVTFRHAGREVTTQVIDRGPYTRGRTWDLSHGLCQALNHCFTGSIEWRLG